MVELNGTDAMSIVEFSSDISEAEAPEPLPVGEYPATIRAAEIRVSTNSGNKYAAVTFHISPDYFPADYPTDIAPDGKVIIHRRLVMEDDARSRYNVRQFCTAIGAPMAKVINVGDWVGLEAKVEIGHSMWEGVQREDIVRITEA